MSIAEKVQAGVETKSAALPWAIAGLMLAAVGVAGSLYLSIGMGLIACPLCFYQRAFLMGVFAIFEVGLLVDRKRPGLLCLLSLPLVFGGLGVAGFHEFLVVTGKMECPTGMFNLGTAPAQSLTLFVLLALCTAMGMAAGRKDFAGSPVLAGWGTVILGLLLAWGSVKSSPPSRQPPKDIEHLICRPLSPS